MPELIGTTDGTGLRMCIVVATWNGFITDKLLEGAVAAFKECGVGDDDVTVVRVPGAFEIPTAARWAAASSRFDAVVCLGAVIRGETAHFEYVSGGATYGILNTSQATGVPVIFGVLTVDTVQQALDRTGGKDGHKGDESARAAIEMATLRKQLTDD